MSGRLVVVTGGGGGIGRAVAERFSALGDEVLAPGRAELDVTDEASVTAFFEAADGVDVLVNNAGTAESAPLQASTLESWRAHLDVNATGPFLCTRAVLAVMRSRGSGAIVTVASTAGLEGSRYTAAYTASKHAAVGLMRATAAEVAGTGVTANAVCPGYVDTPMTDATVAAIADRMGTSTDEARAVLERRQPIQRLVHPDEVAAAVLSCVQNGAINGQGINVDGGAVQS